MTTGAYRTIVTALALIMSMSCWRVGPVAAGAALEVDAVKSAKTLPGTLEVVGVVAKRNASTGTFSLVDRGEFRKCQSVSCANFLLPVRWNGKIPSTTSVVKVKGAVRETREGRFLFAESVEAAGK